MYKKFLQITLGVVLTVLISVISSPQCQCPMVTLIADDDGPCFKAGETYHLRLSPNDQLEWWNTAPECGKTQCLMDSRELKVEVGQCGYTNGVLVDDWSMECRCVKHSYADQTGVLYLGISAFNRLDNLPSQSQNKLNRYVYWTNFDHQSQIQRYLLGQYRLRITVPPHVLVHEADEPNTNGTCAVM